MITGYDLAEYLFSDYENEEERLYSTGDEELDELLERAFSEGYEYAQREFAKVDYRGLNIFQKLKLKSSRNAIAKDLKAKRMQINKNHDVMLRGGEYSPFAAKWNTNVDRMTALQNSRHKSFLAKEHAKMSPLGKKFN